MTSAQWAVGVIESLMALAQHRPGCQMMDGGTGSTCDCPFAEIMEDARTLKHALINRGVQRETC